MKTRFLTALATASAPLLVVYADMQDVSTDVGKDPFALPGPPTPQPQPQPKPDARPSDEAIGKAVREVLAEMPGQPLSGSGAALSGGPYKEFARQFSDAERPHCMGPNALKHQPASTVYKGWNIGVGGIFALPFWATAIVRGKCNWNR